MNSNTTHLTEIEWLRRELSDYRRYLPPCDLRDEIGAWLDESTERRDADALDDYVESRLTEIQSEYAMHNAPHVDDPADAFPDDCKGCRHYGAACPVFWDRTEVRWRRRKIAAAETERDARNVYHQLATDTGCQLIPRWLEEWDDDLSEFIRRGYRLETRADDYLQDDYDHDHPES